MINSISFYDTKGKQLMKIINHLKNFDKKWKADGIDIYMLVCSLQIKEDFSIKEKNPIKRFLMKKSNQKIMEQTEDNFYRIMIEGNLGKLKNIREKDLHSCLIKVESFLQMYGQDEIAIYGFMKAFGFNGKFRPDENNSPYKDEEEIKETYELLEMIHKENLWF